MVIIPFLKIGFLGNLPQIHEGKGKIQIPGSYPTPDEPESQWWEGGMSGNQESKI